VAATVTLSVLEALRARSWRIRDLYTQVARWISRRRASLTSRSPFLVGEAPHYTIHGNNTSSAFIVSLGSCWYPWVRLWCIEAPDCVLAGVRPLQEGCAAARLDRGGKR
jgi:hypothetical protein